MATKKIAGVTRKDLLFLDPKLVRSEPGFNARTEVGDVSDLVASMRDVGVLQPIVVRPDRGGDGQTLYVVIDGHRRLAAAQALRAEGVEISIPVVRQDVNAEEAVVLMAVAGLQRKDFTPVEEGRLVRRFVSWGWNHQKVADKLGKSLGWVQQRVALAGLPEAMAAAVTNGTVPADVAAKMANCQEAAIAEVLDAAKQGRGAARKAAQKATGKPGKPGVKEIAAVAQAIRDSSRNRTARTTVALLAALEWAAGKTSLDAFRLKVRATAKN